MRSFMQWTSVQVRRIIAQRSFSSSLRTQSHIGSQPIHIPESVTIALDVQKFNAYSKATPLIVKGPKGVLQVSLPEYARLDLTNEGRKLFVNVADSKVKVQRQMWGTLRSIINSDVTGVTEGHIAILKFVGVGYRAELVESGTKVSVKVGQSDTKLFTIPENVAVLNPQPTKLVLEGADKRVVSQFAATIRALKPPEPYKGKGIYVNDETIRLKNKKVK
ncbi:ribosomal protein L6, alpha-beta domain-containing protein [Lipomyces japonicus]|uniref:mitochondrial 54S ribosomal protein uL6m n=1 Tax=Lipomyces japonicus TaxID=56871 RepID=UPI0034CD0AF0